MSDQPITTKRWLAAAVLLASSATWTLAQDNEPTTQDLPDFGPILAHSDSAFARELLRLNQGALLKVAAEGAKGTPNEGLYRSQAVIAGWLETKQSRSKTAAAVKEYLANVQAYLDQPEVKKVGLDGGWALDQAKFVFGQLSEPVLNRMEYWSTNSRDRAELEPMAQLAERLLTVAKSRLEAVKSAAENAKPFNEDQYMKSYNAAVEVDYYRAWAAYYLAMSMNPANPKRPAKLKEATDILAEWADGDETSGVKYQAMLLRGKAYSEAGNTAAALVDLTGATAAGAPDWVKYQARYQTVVAKLRAKNYPDARAELQKFKDWIEAQPGTANPAARISADMLGYRVAWAEANTKPVGKERDDARAAALKILSDIIAKDARFRELVFDQLATQAADEADLAALAPMQQLALAWSKAQAAAAAGKESEAATDGYTAAVAAAKAVRDNKAASKAEVMEATGIAAACETQLGHLLEAVRLELDFADAAAGDKRGREMLESALTQIRDLRKGNTSSADMQAITLRALDLATSKYQMSTMQFANGMALKEKGDIDKALVAFERVRSDDPSYLDARYQVVLLNVEKVSKLSNTASSDPAQVKAAAKELLTQCDGYLGLIRTAPAEAKDRAKKYMLDLRLIQVATAINQLQDAQACLANIKQLEDDAKANGIEIATAMRGALLRYEIMAYQATNQTDKVMAALQQLPPADAPAIIRGLIKTNMDEIDQIEESNPTRAKGLALNVAQLLDSLIKMHPQTTEKEKAAVVAYQQWRLEMLAQGGQAKEAREQWRAWKKDDPTNAVFAMGEARASYLMEDWPAANDEFVEMVPKLPLGSESYWEAYLRIIQCEEKMGKSGAHDRIVALLKDFKASYGDKIGGERFGKEYKGFLMKYGL